MYYIQHHGILGQKWGVRRFQNKDGSLTNAGRKRYHVSDKERNKSKTHIDNFVRGYGTKQQESEKQYAKKQMDYYKKLGVEGYKKKIIGYDEDDDIVKDMYNEELRGYEKVFKEADVFIKNSRIMEQKISNIDLTSTKYRKVKKLVREYHNEMINNSLSEIHQEEKKN